MKKPKFITILFVVSLLCLLFCITIIIVNLILGNLLSEISLSFMCILYIITITVLNIMNYKCCIKQAGKEEYTIVCDSNEQAMQIYNELLERLGKKYNQ